MQSAIFIGSTALLLLTLTGCSDTYMVDRFQIHQQGWDTLQVDVQFVRTAAFGSPKVVQPQDHTIFVFNAAYDTLYADTASVVVINDRELGNEERVMVEVCGGFGAITICEQETVAASPKRLLLEHDLAYPEDEDYDRGRFDFHFVAERQVFETEAWEPIKLPRRVSGYVLAYVGEEVDEAVKVPFSRRKGRFNLTRYAHYKDFQYHLQSQLFDGDQADVRFDVYAGFNGQAPYRLASISKQLRNKTPEERFAEADYFGGQAAERVLQRLDVRERGEDMFVSVGKWEYKKLTKTYFIDLELGWREGRRLFGSRGYFLEGVIEVKEDGTEARFRRITGNERARSRWNDVVRGPLLFLDTLDPFTSVEDEALADENSPE